MIRPRLGMRSALLLGAVILGAVCTLAVVGCTRSDISPKAAAKVTACVLAAPTDLPPFVPRTIWIVGLDGSVSTRTVDAAPRSPLALSPDGHTLLYATGAPPLVEDRAFPPTSLHALDLDTGRDTLLVKGSSVLGYGWDSTGRLVALTGRLNVASSWPPEIRRTFGIELRPVPGTTSELVVWHGVPGSLATAAVEASMPVNARTLVASDGETAYFSGADPSGLIGTEPMYDSLWRYDFASHRLELAHRYDPPNAAMCAPPRDDLPVRTHVESAYYGAPPFPWNLPSVGLPFFTAWMERPGGSGFTLLRYSDLLPRASVGTSAPGAVFDATFSRYLVRVDAEHAERFPLGQEPSDIVEADMATGQRSVVNWKDGPSVHPIGYLGDTRAFLFTSSEPGGMAVVLQEPGESPRVILHASGPYEPWATWPGLLGVQTAE